jgi:lipopolysaccharide transport system permease protein
MSAVPGTGSKSGSGMSSGWISELISYRELLFFLAWREVKVRYKQAALGASWAILQPLLTMVIFTLFFGRIGNVPSNGVPYPLFSFSGLVVWTYFASTLSMAGNSLISNSNLITKVYFPRVLLPAASALSGMVDFLVGASFLVILMVYYRIAPGPGLIFAPLFLALLVAFVMGVSMWLAALNVRYRDVKYTIPFMIQLGIFVTPIIYPLSYLPKRYQMWVALNPMSGIVEGLRMSLFAPYDLDWSLLWPSVTVTVLVLAFGWTYFHRTEKEFADII